MESDQARLGMGIVRRWKRSTRGEEKGMRRCADLEDCGYDNRDSDLFCRACALPLLRTPLAGRYVVDALLSKGGYAAVFRGVDQNLSRYVAIKVLLPSKTTLNEHENFLREARIAAALDHPNIAPVLDYGKDKPSVFLIMPLYTAGSLRTRLAAANGPLPAPETIHNFHQLVAALHYAHTRPRPVIHRDIKPENILIHQEDQRLVITDFGIARSLEPGTRVGMTITVRGTVGYMAPEQANGIVDPRSDQYGCAVVLYEMLTGYHPHDPFGGSIPPPSTLNDELPSGLDEVLLRVLSSRPEDRYMDMQEFMRSFDAACRASTSMRIATARPGVEGRNQVAGRRATHPQLASQAVQGGTGKNEMLGRAYEMRVTPRSSVEVREKCQEGDQLLRQQQYAQALRMYEEALGLSPRNFHAWNGKGTALYNQGNYRKAYEAFQRATEIDQDSAVVWVSAGLALHRLQRYQQALVHFERALSIDPRYVAAWNGKADTQLDMSLSNEAIASYEQALDYDQHSFHAWNGLGNARSALRDFAGAVEAYSHALMVNPRSAVAWCNKAEALIRLGHTRASLDALNEATELDRGYTRAWTLKADVYELLGNHQEAQKARRRVKPWGLMN
ncbi:MAG: serine/threonine-protein kinase [Chloroflexota bacterium]|nr:serine/threonine-protein kinase [Chloroflexota bacterium]